MERQNYFPSGLFDLDRVEVLRGVQGQLFGANTTVGLLNLATKNPTDEFTGSIDVERGELERQRIEAAVGGPLLPGFLNFRVAGLTDERDGYVENTTARTVAGANEILGGRDRQAVRLKLDFPDLFGGSLLLSYQRDDMDADGTLQELTSVPQRLRPLLRDYDPDADFEPNNFIASIDTPSFLETSIECESRRRCSHGVETPVGKELLDFPIGTCVTDRPNTDGDDEPRCDLTGGPLEQAPKWDVTMTPRVRVPLTSIPGFGPILPASFLGGIDLTSGLTVEYVDTRFLSDTLDPRTRQPSFFLVDANVGFGNESQGWSLQVTGENLTDEAIHNFAFESPSTGGMISKAPAPPRLFFGKFRWQF